ncbi:ureidoglycolate lyase [Aquabacter spiritensis]|uniref:Ureidoglycolate lyase n=1 Tax=Aquabacter spiritensis TaxID=933073 RepID=A0A4R3LTL4_9HYPH|nr:ureidoglycolate lyase [Aquabacter spiritensis]TCT01677.1 ureidoglycolate lyase [Aquabacter spiritensis]
MSPIAMSPIVARALTADAFAPFGEVLRLPDQPGRRDYFDGGLANLRPDAAASLSLILAAPVLGRPVPVAQFERHAFSSQSFVPLALCRWLVAVAPHAAGGGPDMTRVAAFVPGAGQGITLRADVWHAPLTVLDAAAPFAIFMWRDGGPRDEEFAEITPFRVAVDAPV